MKIILKNELIITIIGCKEFNNYSFFEKNIYEVISPYLEKGYIITIREREINDTDNFSILFCKENNFNLERYKVQWKEKGKSAGIWNAKALIYGEDISEQRPTEILVVFLTSDMKEDRGIEFILEEFNSCITHKSELKEADIRIFCED